MVGYSAIYGVVNSLGYWGLKIKRVRVVIIIIIIVMDMNDYWKIKN